MTTALDITNDLLSAHKAKGREAMRLLTVGALVRDHSMSTEQADTLVTHAMADLAEVTPRGRKASDIKRARRRWAWDDWMPLGVLTSIFGEEGLGKGNVTMRIAADLTRGKLPGEFYGKPQPVTIVSFEDDESVDLLPRLLANGADLDLVTIYTEGDNYEPILTLPDGLAQMEEEIASRGDRLLIIDPLPDALAERLKDNNNKDVRAALVPLQAMAKRQNMAILGVLHPNKGATTAANKIMGSKAFRSVPRSVILLGPNPNDPDGDSRILCLNKGNVAKTRPSIELRILNKRLGGCPEEQDEDGNDLGDAPYVEWGKASKFNDQEIIAYQTTGKIVTADEPSTQAERARSLILALLDANGGEVPAKTAYAAGEGVGVSEATMKRARQDLNVNSEGNVWVVPDGWTPDLEF